jgi:hypothetical protein
MGLGVVCSSAGVSVAASDTQGGISFKGGGAFEKFSVLCPSESPAFIARKPGQIAGQFDLGLWVSIGGPGYFRLLGKAQDAECFHLPAGGQGLRAGNREQVSPRRHEADRKFEPQRP